MNLCSNKHFKSLFYFRPWFHIQKNLVVKKRKCIVNAYVGLGTTLILYLVSLRCDASHVEAWAQVVRDFWRGPNFQVQIQTWTRPRAKFEHTAPFLLLRQCTEVGIAGGLCDFRWNEGNFSVMRYSCL